MGPTGEVLPEGRTNEEEARLIGEEVVSGQLSVIGKQAAESGSPKAEFQNPEEDGMRKGR